MSWLDAYFQTGYKTLAIAGVPVTAETILNIVSGATAADNPGLGRTDVTIAPTTNSLAFGTAATQLATSGIDYLQTTNATPTSFAGSSIYTMPDNTAVDVIVTIIGKRISSADYFIQDYRARYTRSGGAPTLDNVVITGSNGRATGSISTATATLIIVGNTIVPQVTGVAATNINWCATLQAQQVQ